MKEEQFNEGKELLELIKITENGLKELYKIVPEERDSQVIYDDKLCNLCISQYKDGSGGKADLSRYYGNKKLLEAIIAELEAQLKVFKDKFEKL